ncbi:MAG: metal-binding protein [Lachnospiraceae bacterium]|nr:metal-binding protein [Lachnospiraceae bacterium]
MKASERFFTNSRCRYFPCHEGIDREEFNCLFCYCPLYFAGKDCGGDFMIKDGVKSCINCKRPHIAGNFDEINARLKEEIKRHRVT